jgi:hypothetical protein
MVLSSFCSLFRGRLVEFKKTDPLPKPSPWPSQVGRSLSLKACLAIKKQNGCQEKYAKSYLAEIAKKTAAHWVVNRLTFAGHSC